jgi:hypothetical protein
MSVLIYSQASVCAHLLPDRCLRSPFPRQLSALTYWKTVCPRLLKDRCLHSHIPRLVVCARLFIDCMVSVLTHWKTGVCAHLLKDKRLPSPIERQVQSSPFQTDLCAHLFKDRRLSSPIHRQVSPVPYLKAGVYLSIQRQLSALTYSKAGVCALLLMFTFSQANAGTLLSQAGVRCPPI